MTNNAINEMANARRVERGTKRCIADAWKIIVFQWRVYLRAMAAYSVVAGIGLTLFIYMCGRVARETLLPMYLLVQSGEKVADVWSFYAPSMVEWGMPLLFCLLWWGAHVLWRSALLSQAEHWAMHGCWPAGCFPLRRSVFGRWRRLLLFDAVASVVGLLLMAVVLLLVLKSSWWSVAPVVLLVLFLLWAAVARLHFAFRATSVLKSYVAVVKDGARRLGSVLLLLVITGAVMLPITLMFAFPYAVPEGNATYDAIGQIMGDAPALPPYFYWLYPLVGMVVGSFFYLVRGWQPLVLALRFLPYRREEKHQKD
ncbi:MAG: hypothetical protein IKU63_06415 [Bacteroidaceae bacterium]|nr:hypothetical protein [Bacteroidaceae bacterium]